MPTRTHSNNELDQRRIAMMTMAWAGLVAIFFAIRGIISDIPERYFPLLLVAAVCAYSVFKLKRGDSSQGSAFIAISAIAFGIFVAVYTNGGIRSVAATWILVIPFLAGLMGQTRVALYGIFLAFACLVSFLLVDLTYGIIPDLTPIEQQYQQNRFHQFGQLITICICFAYYVVKVKNHHEALNQEIQLKRVAEKESRQASLAKSQFLANMSHEIRTPLNGIISTLSLFAKTKQTAEQKRLLEIANISSTSLLSLINDVLDLSKIEAGKFQLETQPTNILHLIDAMNTLYQYRCKDKGIEFICHRPDTPLWVNADVMRIRQIIENLLSNALKFTEQGNITLHTDYQEMDQDYIKFNINVSDTGIGMTDKQQERIFDSFTQADGSTTRIYGGTGLGLTICKQLIVLMDGTLKLKSQINKGSEFNISLPLKKSLEQNDLPDSTPSAVPQHYEDETAKKILLVEDNEINMEIIKSLLEDYEFEILEARNGKQAIDILKQEPDINGILMDCQMPIMDGYEATAAIREHQDFSCIPIIAMTANAMQGDKEKCLAAGMNAYISKPINPAALHKELEQFNLIH